MHAISQQSIKYNNLKRIYSLIGRQEANSRAQLAHVTKLSKTTISSLVEELLFSGYIVESGADASTALGRKPCLLEINGARNFVAVIAWHRRKLIGALVNTRTEIAALKEWELSEQEDYVSRTVELLNEELLPMAGAGRVLATCIVVPSMVDEENQRIISTVLNLGERDDVVHRLRAALVGCPLVILNDTACYAYAEYVAADIQEEFVFVNIGKGIGAVLLNRGVMMRGANGMTTQFGHFSIDRNGPRCDCGNRGCLECAIGEGALEELSERYGLRDVLPVGKKIQFRDVGALLGIGDKRALALVEQLAEDLAYGLSNLIALIHPKLVVLGGFGMNLGQCYLQLVQKKLSGMGFPQFVEDVRVRFACVDELAELQGAARYYLDQHFSFAEEMRDRLILS